MHFETLNLENGLTVALRLSQNPVISVDFYFRGGTLVEPNSFIGEKLLCALTDVGRRKWLIFQPKITREMYSLKTLADRDQLETQLKNCAELFWGKDSPITDSSEGVECQAEFGVQKDEKTWDLLREQLYRVSPYRKPLQNKLVEASGNKKVQSLQRNYFHPANSILVIEGNFDLDGMRRFLQGDFGKRIDSTFGSSFAYIEDWPETNKAQRVVFGDFPKVRILYVFPAPPRGSMDWLPTIWVTHSLREKWPSHKVHTWAGVGVGLIWVEHTTSPEKFSAVLESFSSEIQRCFQELQGDPFSIRKRIPESFWSTEDVESMATDYFWGGGVEKALASQKEANQVGVEDMQRVLRSYFSKPIVFVLWPEKEKESWKGWSEK